MPVRIQLSRRRGWRKPDGAVVVARPSKWGNPFTLPMVTSMLTAHTDGEPPEPGVPFEQHCRRRAVEAFRDALVGGDLEISVDDVRRELAGKDLCCWCPLDKACHADVLLEIANSGSEGSCLRTANSEKR